MNKKIKPFVILAVLAALALGVWQGYALLTHGRQSTDDAQVDADVVPISARVGGVVLAVPVHDDQPVKRGDLLVAIDPADYQARVDQAQADVAAAQAQAAAADAQARVVESSGRGGLTSAQAQLSGSTVSVRTAEAQINVARANLARAQSDLKKAENDLGRAQKLRGEGAVPQIELDNAQSARDSANAALAQAQANLAAAEEQRQVARSRVTEAQGHVDQSTNVNDQVAAARAQSQLAHARVDAAQAALAQAQIQLGNTKVVAPADGYLSRLAVHPGQLVQAGQPIVGLVPDDTFVVANFKETQIARMKPGQRVKISIDAYGGKDLHGKITSISPATGARFSLLPPDNATGNFVKVVQRVPVKIAWDGLPTGLRPAAGLSCDVTVYTD